MSKYDRCVKSTFVSKLSMWTISKSIQIYCPDVSVYSAVVCSFSHFPSWWWWWWWTALCFSLLPLWSQFTAHLCQASLFQICGGRRGEEEEGYHHRFFCQLGFNEVIFLFLYHRQSNIFRFCSVGRTKKTLKDVDLTSRELQAFLFSIFNILKTTRLLKKWLVIKRFWFWLT